MYGRHTTSKVKRIEATTKIKIKKGKRAVPNLNIYINKPQSHHHRHHSLVLIVVFVVQFFVMFKFSFNKR